VGTAVLNPLQGKISRCNERFIFARPSFQSTSQVIPAELERRKSTSPQNLRNGGAQKRRRTDCTSNSAEADVIGNANSLLLSVHSCCNVLDGNNYNLAPQVNNATRILRVNMVYCELMSFQDVAIRRQSQLKLRSIHGNAAQIFRHLSKRIRRICITAVTRLA